MRWLALAALPWGTILKEGAALLRQANDLRSSAGRQPGPPPSDDVHELRHRVAELERQQRADAELMQQMATQIEAVAVAAQATALKMRQALLLAMAAIAIALVAVVLGVIR